MRGITVFLILFLTLGCSTTKQRKPPPNIALFYNLEKMKCGNDLIDGYLLRTGRFESLGKSPDGNRGYSIFAGYRDFVGVVVGDYFYIITSDNPNIYNYIIKNGNYSGTTTTGRQKKTALVYSIGTDMFYVEKEQLSGTNHRSYSVYSFCSEKLRK